MVNVFGKQLGEEKHPHLKNFYLIIPALSVNYVEYMIAAKDKMAKNNFNGAAFTDDGLAMGALTFLRNASICLLAAAENIWRCTARSERGKKLKVWR